MIPLLIKVNMDGYRFWVPLFLVWILALPFALLLSPVVAVSLLAARVNPVAAITAFWRLLSAARGTHIEAHDGSRPVLIHIY